MKKRWIFLIVILLFFVFTPLSIANETLYDVYIGPIGIEIKSYSPNWTGEKLKEVYDELLNNRYGEEIEYLSSINLYPNHPFEGEEEGLYHGAYQSNVFLNKNKYKMKKNRRIDLFNMREKEKVEEIAKILSHEYGHHFTLYYILKEENKTFDEWKDTRYAKIRGLTDDSRVRNDYSNGHQWSIMEIAAEDYTQLYGSINAKTPKYYDDIIVRAEKQRSDETIKWNNHIFNVYPQENIHIPLANNIPALGEYWDLVSGIEIKQKNQAPTPSVVGLTDIKNLGYDKNQFIISWTESKDVDSSNLLYTLVASDEQRQQVIPLKTVKQGEERVAALGSAKIRIGNQIIFYSDTFIDTPKDIRVFTMDEHGNIVSSNAVKVDFNNPVITDIQSVEYIEEKRVDGQNEDHNKMFSEHNKKKRKTWPRYIVDFIMKLIKKAF